MNHYDLQSTSPEERPRATKAARTADNPSEANLSNHPQHAALQGEVDPVLHTLAMLQRQQNEQTHLLRQLLQEIETLKLAQNQQSSTVTKLDRRMRWARFWRLTWLLTRVLIFGGAIGFLIYLIGVDQIRAMWERLVWLFT